MAHPKKTFFIFFLFFFSTQIKSLVFLGGYVPFGPHVKKDLLGNKNLFNFGLSLGLNQRFHFPTTISTAFFPEMGLVFHGTNEFRNYSKYTTYFLADLGYPLGHKGALPLPLIFRYGVGLFFTTIKGDGNSVVVDSSIFYSPNQAITAYNATLNLGLEGPIQNNVSWQFESFIFFPLNSGIKISYLFGVNYYL